MWATATPSAGGGVGGNVVVVVGTAVVAVDGGAVVDVDVVASRSSNWLCRSSWARASAMLVPQSW